MIKLKVEDYCQDCKEFEPEVDTYTGIIDNVETYEALRDGKLDFNPNIKSKIENITIPYDLFIRLMELDKEREDND